MYVCMYVPQSEVASVGVLADVGKRIRSGVSPISVAGPIPMDLFLWGLYEAIPYYSYGPIGLYEGILYYSYGPIQLIADFGCRTYSYGLFLWALFL